MGAAQCIGKSSPYRAEPRMYHICASEPCMCGERWVQGQGVPGIMCKSMCQEA